MKKELLRTLPKIDELLKLNRCNEYINLFNREIVVTTLREILNCYRNEILQENINSIPNIEEIVDKCGEKLKSNLKPNLKRVVNGTGVVIHTNLGRSVLSKDAIDSMVNVASHYNNLEYDISSGERGTRYSHIEELIKKITGSEAALVVNNNAAAILLAINTMCENKEVVVSRGELVEIGGSFRIPDVINFSKARLIEVGTTNRTHEYDYENAITENTAALLKVHTSNFKIIGFTNQVNVKQLADLGKKYEIPVIEDIGSGTISDLSSFGLEKEHTIIESLKNGIDIVTFSGDKILGGPQAGIIVGKKKYIDRIKKNQLTRALRVDKFTLAALETTLKHYLYNEELEKIPTLAMITISEEELKSRSDILVNKLLDINDKFNINIIKGVSTVGGGAMPESELQTYLVKISSGKINEVELEKRLRDNEIPIVCRVSKGEVLIDVRTLLNDDVDIIYNALKKIGEEL